MPKRNLRIVRRALPPLGICEYCNTQFKLHLSRVDEAVSEIQTLFDAHKCERQGFSQAAARTIRLSHWPETGS